MGKAGVVTMDFLFLGNQLALDFVNTRPMVNGDVIELLPDFPSLLRWFEGAGLLTAGETAKLKQKWRDPIVLRRALGDFWKFREMLRAEILRLENDTGVRRETVEEINRLMAEHPMLFRVKSGSKGRELQAWFDLRQPEELFAPLAKSASELFTLVDFTRLRKCEVCILHFLDTSKKGSRRWCSMQLCGNRSKVAAYAARQRAKSEETH